jgi:hypothetical protein
MYWVESLGSRELDGVGSAHELFLENSIIKLFFSKGDPISKYYKIAFNRHLDGRQASCCSSDVATTNFS